MHRAFLLLSSALLLSLFLLPPRSATAFDPETLPHVGFHTSGISYWDTPYFANAFYQGGQWLEYAPVNWGSSVAWWDSPQFDANGYPLYLNPGMRLRAIPFGLHTDQDNRPPTWPARYGLAQGRVVLEWKGEADIRPNASGTFLPGDSNGAATGVIEDGRRVYQFSGGARLEWLEIYEINPDEPVTDIKVWLPDPADPENATLEGELFHPTILERLTEADWGFVRTMNLQATNANPQQDWSDRRLPGHAFMTGILNPRAPAQGAQGNRDSGIAFEQMVQLANESGLDLWLCVPHLAADEFVQKLARLIRYGSDGTEPYGEPVTEPVYPPLDPSLRIYVEYSNEIWASGHSFPQGDWAQQQATAAGISKPQFNARRFCEVWRIFQEEFGGTDRLVRVAAVFTAADWYTEPFLNEIASYGPGLTPPVEPDVIAVTTYFSNGIQDWANGRAIAQAGSDDQWFYTADTFNAGGGTMRNVSVPPGDSYWTSGDIERHLEETFTEWTRRLLSGDAREGGGPDAVGIGGGFEVWLRELAHNTFPTPKPVVSYEGGPSIYTDYMDWGDPRDDGITTFMEALNRHPQMRDVYNIHLNMAEAKGLWTHTMFTESGRWGKYGQWGHLEHIAQPNEDAPKYQFLLDWMEEKETRRHIDRPEGAVPVFVTPHNLPVSVYGEPYEAFIEVSGGDGTPSIDLIGSLLQAGLEYDPLLAEENRVRVHGTSTEAGLSYVYLRVCDEDGDCAWRTYNVRTVGGPNTILESDFTGTAPVQNLPWSNTYILSPEVGFGGISAGGGIIPQSGDDAIVWSVNAPPEEADATLAQAIANGNYLEFTLVPGNDHALSLAGQEMRFTIRRIDYHAPRRYVVFTSIGGFEPGAEVFHSARYQSESDLEFVFDFPDSEAYMALTESVAIRLYGYAAQWGGHATSLRALRLDGLIGQTAGLDGNDWHFH